MSREQILANLRTSLASSRAFLAGEAARAPHTVPPYVLPPAADLAEQFATELRAVAGKAYRAADDKAAVEQIGAILAERGVGKVLAWDFEQLGLAGLPEHLAERGVRVVPAKAHGAARKGQLQAMEPAGACISGVEAGIAESGSLLLRHGPGRPRLASLLAPAHIAVLRSTQLVRGLGEALAQARARYGESIFHDTSNLTLITGPSRTADIEMTLALGIHGPQEIHVVVIQH